MSDSTPEVQVYVKDGRPARLVRSESARVAAVFEGFRLDQKASARQEKVEAEAEKKAEADAKPTSTTRKSS